MSIREQYLAYRQRSGKTLNKKEDFKVKFLATYLSELGYTEAELDWNCTISAQVGTRTVNPKVDVVASIDGVPLMVIDTKDLDETITGKDQLKVESCAKLVSALPAVYAVTTNGRSTTCTNVFTGIRMNDIPSRTQLVHDAGVYRTEMFDEIQLREIRAILITLLSSTDFQKVVSACKRAIERNAGIRSDQSFREMTRVLLVKMAEERRAEGRDPQENRFTVEWFDTWSMENGKSCVDALCFLFDEACTEYSDVYDDDNRRALQISDEHCVRMLVDMLEPFSLLGTGDDIKGQMYEVFLKGTLRGDFDQYFTPHEIVDFMVKFADPQINDRILDPACGSGGFLIQALNHVREKIASLDDSPAHRQERIQDLAGECLWGQETDYDLHILARINLIMHGDRHNNIKQGDTLKTDFLPENHFDVILMNPPFTIPCNDGSVLARYGIDSSRSSEELDILFVREAILRLKPGKTLYTVLPEGMVNTRSYLEFRTWLLDQGDLVLSVSLPEGAFIPFGASVSKTCIVGIRKNDNVNNKLNNRLGCFAGRACFIGFETGKKGYRAIKENNLAEFLKASTSRFDGILECSGKGECGWVDASVVSRERIDAGFLLNLIARDALRKNFGKVARLGDIVDVENIKIRPSGTPLEKFRYFEVPAIGVGTGSLTNVR